MLSSGNRVSKKIRTGRIKMMAAAWFARMRSDECRSEDEQRLQAWLAAAPEHEAAYADIRRTFEAVGRVSDTPEIIAMRAAVSWRRPFVPRLLAGAPRRTVVAASLAACLLLALALSARQWPGWAGGAIYQTDPGERSTIALNDGTQVTLTSDSRVIEDFSLRQRRVRLVRGEAYFDVVHDAERPFVVEAGSGEITALGTQFDVYRKNDGAVVTLVEGKVQVVTFDKRHTDERSVKLQSGEQVSVDKGTLSEVRKVDTARAVSWRQGRLRVSNRPFIEVADEFNRHSRYKLYIDRGDRRFRSIKISGYITTDRPERLVEQLRNSSYVKQAGLKVWPVRDSAGNIRLRLYPETSRN